MEAFHMITQVQHDGFLWVSMGFYGFLWVSSRFSHLFFPIAPTLPRKSSPSSAPPPRCKRQRDPAPRRTWFPRWGKTWPGCGMYYLQYNMYIYILCIYIYICVCVLYIYIICSYIFLHLCGSMQRGASQSFYVSITLIYIWYIIIYNKSTLIHTHTYIYIYTYIHIYIFQLCIYIYQKFIHSLFGRLFLRPEIKNIACHCSPSGLVCWDFLPPWWRPVTMLFMAHLSHETPMQHPVPNLTGFLRDCWPYFVGI